MIVPSGLQLRLDPRDDYPHTPEPVSNYNESMYFDAFDRASGVSVWMRLGNRPNEGRAEMSCCVHLPDGQVGFMAGRPEICGNAAMNAGGLRFEVVEPFHVLETHYQGELLVMDNPLDLLNPSAAFKRHPKRPAAIRLRFEGISPVDGGELVTSAGERAELDPDKVTCRGHLEQHMLATGEVDVGGRRWTISRAWGYRDKSWGPRHWHSYYWYRWLTVTFGPDFGIQMCLRGREGAAAHVSGHVFRDGGLHPIQTLDIATEWDEQGFHRSFVANLETHDRHYRVRGQVRSLLPLRHKSTRGADGADSFTRICKGVTDYTCDDHVGIGMSEFTDQMTGGMAISRRLGQG